jgi:ABC-type antimicrobial peptide transport system permease subunit
VAVVIRSTGDAEALASTVRRALAELDPDLPMQDFRTLESYLSEAAAAPRFALLLLAAFGAAAILLCGVALYGVMSQSLALRRREMGVRLALGARPGALVTAALAEGARRALLGMLMSVTLAVPFALLLRRLLYGVTPFDPIAWLGAALALGLIALLASLGPARRMARLDPVEALRSE